MIKKFMILLFVCVTFYANAQEYQPIDTANFALREKLIKHYNKEHSYLLKKIKKKYKGKLRNKITQIYQERNDEFLKKIKKKRFLFDARFTNFIDSILNLVQQSNSNLKDKPLKIYISKYLTMNAVSIGRNHIILHLGLFKYLENEEQLVAVLAHEIAHEKLKHVEKNIDYLAKLGTSKARRLQAKTIRKQKYNQYDKSFKILKNLMYSEGKLNRRKEMLADSIGYLIYKNTGLAKISFLNSLKLLEQYDSLPSIAIDSNIYHMVFDIPNQPFKKEWLQKEQFSNYDYSKYTEKINKDSIKSHPEIRQRIEKLYTNFPELKKESIKSTKSDTFKRLQNIVKQEDIANLHNLKKYGASIQLILHKLSKNPTDTYLKKYLGINFLSLYDAKKKYQFNRYVDKINPKEQTKSQIQFLSFLWNLNLEEIKNIGDYYTEN